MLRPGLYPPLPGMRINNNLLPGTSVSDTSGDRIDPLSAALCRGWNLRKLDGRVDAGFPRLATLESESTTQDQSRYQLRDPNCEVSIGQYNSSKTASQ